MGKMAKVFDSEITPELIYLAESLRTDGYWSIKSGAGAFQNKDRLYLTKIEELLNSFGINVIKRLLIKIKVSSDDNKVYVNGIRKNIHMQKNNIPNVCNKLKFNLPWLEKQNFTLVNSDKMKEIIIEIKDDSILNNFEGTCYVYGELRFNSISFVRFLDKNFSKETMQIEFGVLKTENHSTALISAIIDAEGSINYHQHYRTIRVRMYSERYLSNLREVCLGLGLPNTSIRSRRGLFGIEYCLTITGKYAFDILTEKGLKLYHSKKKEKLFKINNSYTKIGFPKNYAASYYLNYLTSNGPKTSVEISKALNRSCRVVCYWMNLLEKKSLISLSKVGNTKVYSIKNEK